jgi:predicted MPP superfamily phosphohydrolase
MAGAAGAAYALYEPYRFRLMTKEIPLRPGTPALTVLHVSDLHLRASSHRLMSFLEKLPDELGEVPDLVIATGDFVEDDSSMKDVVSLLARLEARVGRFFVYGSHDYFRATRPSYTKYFTGRSTPKPIRRDETPMTEALEAKGWRNLTNRTEIVESPHGKIRVSGVDDPYLKWHRTGHIERHDESLAIGVVHAPDVVSEWILNGFDLVVAGHTHAGQVRLPVVGALVTNCSLPTELASGLSRVGPGWLHVSPGLGHGRFTPIRFGARPEVTLLRLNPEGPAEH